MTLARSSASPITCADDGDVGVVDVAHGDGHGRRTDGDVDSHRADRDRPLDGSARGRRRRCRHGGRTCPFAGGELDRQLVTGHERHLDEPEDQHRDQREAQRELDGRLTGIVQTRSITESMTRSKRSSDLAGSTASRGPADDEQRDERGGEQHQRVLGGRLAAIGAQARARVGMLEAVELVQARRVEAGEQQCEMVVHRSSCATGRFGSSGSRGVSPQ